MCTGAIWKCLERKHNTETAFPVWGKIEQGDLHAAKPE